MPDEERIGDRDLAEWHTRAGRGFVALVARVVALLARGWRWSLANLALVLTVLVGGGIVLGATILASEVYEEVVDSEGLAALDQPVLDAAVASRTPASEEWVTRFTDLGGTVGMPLIAVAVVVVLAVRRRSWLPVVLMGIAAAGSVVITVLGKDLAARVRPPQALAVPPYETSASFPSGHTLNATVVLGVAAYLVMLGRKHLRSRLLVGSVVVVFVVAMGLSRVWLGHHWLTDVMAGWLVGLAWLGTVVTAHRVKVTLDRAERTAAATASGSPAAPHAVPDPPDAVLGHRRPAGLEPRDGHAEGRARDVVQAGLLEEVDRLGVAAVLAADADPEPGPALAALPRGELHEPPDAVPVDGLERRHPEDAGLHVAREEGRLDVVAREAPRRLGEVVGAEREEVGRPRRCRAAVSAARGSSIIVPTRWSRCTECVTRASWAASSISTRIAAQLLDRADERDHDLRPGVAARARRPMAAASRMARDCISNRPGIAMPEADAPQAEHRVLLVQPVARPEQQGESRSACSPVASASMATLTDRSVRSGRNSCSGGSSRRTVTGSPSIASKSSTKSARWRGSSSLEDLLRSASVSARTSCSTSCPPLAEEHVLGAARPMPSAPNRRARAASSALSALARTCIRRCWSATCHEPVDRGTTGRSPSSTGSSCPRSSGPPGEGRTATSPRNTSPVEPSIEIVSPSRTTCRPGS